MTIVATNNITVSNVNDGTITHTAYAYSADGTDRFTTAYPNLNLLDGTKDFSGTWTNLDSNKWITDGTYKNLVVKKHTTRWQGLYKTFTAPKDGVYTFSAYVKSSGNMADISRFCGLNSTKANTSDRRIGNNFDWIIDTITFNLKANDNVWVRYEISGAGTDSILWNAGHKWEPGSIATLYMPSSSEVKTSDYPSYIGTYSDTNVDGSTDPSKYNWAVFKGADGQDGSDGIAGKDGKGIKATAITYQASANGTTAPTGTWSASVPTVAKGSFLWTRTIWTYTDNTTETGYAVAYMGTNGNNGTNGLAGKDGVGIKTTTITYVGSTNGTTAPTSGWTSTVPTVPAGSYLWTKTVWDYTDNTSETGYSVARMGLKGDKGDPGIKGSDGTSGIIVSSVAPDSPQNGQLWQDTSTIPQLVKKWTGTSWVIWEFYAENLKANSLQTVSAKIGKIYNEFDNSSGGIDNKGTITIEDSVKVVYYLGNSSTTIDLVTSSSGQGLFTQYLPDKTDASKFKQSWYMPTGLYFTDSINNWNGQITAENVTLVPWTNLTYVPGFTTAENNPCQYRKIKNLDGSYTVQFRGQIKPSSGSFAVNSTSYGVSLPSDIMPFKNAFGIGIPDFNAIQNVRLVAVTDSDNPNKNKLQIRVTGGATSYVAIDMLSYTI